MKNIVKTIMVCACVLILTGVVALTGYAEKLVLATLNSVEGQTTAKALREYGELKGIEVEIVEAPYSNLFEKEVLDMSQGTGLYDIILLDDPWFTQFAESNWLTDLTPFFKAKGEAGLSDDFIPTSAAICHHPYKTGTPYALPFFGNAQMFFYRADLFTKYGMDRAPKTWDEALDMMKKIMAGEKGVYGYVMRGEQGNPVVADFMPILWSFGADMFTEDKTQVTLNTPEALNTVKFFLQLRDVSPLGSESFDAQELATYMLQGKAAAMINWPAFVPAFEDPKQSKVVGKVGYAPIPDGTAKGSSEIGHWIAAIPAKAKNKEAAFDFIHWATSAEQQKAFAKALGTPPTRKSVFTDPELTSQPAFKHYPVLMEAIANSSPRPRIANWNEVENTFGIYLSTMVAKKITPEEALAKSQEEVEKLMKKAGYIK
ncbi:sugar ABC transporter binding protein [Candidatus Vecturithrix granuli]|uniref:Sugar ABC transporter binding protein n=1 Tax=Vecturithrix granuli TaxID=1499967 RepID=A0A0S6W9I4_VECG1|nr:sugar ABC transporter binding protein [Candidatus Vecturithrix granuli]